MSRSFRSLRLAPLLFLLIALVGCGGSSDGASSTVIPEPGPGEGTEVVIKTFIFRPDPLTIPVGTSVTFTNLDEILHTVTAGERGAPTGQFDANVDSIGSTFKFTFTEAGTYSYFCKIHPGMDAQIVVR